MTKNQKSSTWDPESTAWNPESKIIIGQLLVEELGYFVNRKTQSKPVFFHRPVDDSKGQQCEIFQI